MHLPDARMAGQNTDKMKKRFLGAVHMPHAQMMPGYDVDLDSWTTCGGNHHMLGWVPRISGQPGDHVRCACICGKASIIVLQHI